jgi:AcrR family transcriptional regulator
MLTSLNSWHQHTNGRTAIKMAEKQSKQKMLNKARALFWSKGYNSTSMQDIARAYSCKPANIYNFFAKKEDILYEVLFEEMEQILHPIRHFENDETTNPVEQLRQIIESHLKITLSYRRSAKLLFDVGLNQLSKKRREKIVALRDAYDQIIRKIIRRGIDAGIFHEVNEKLAGFLIASMITRSRLWYHPKKGVTVQQLIDIIVNFTLNGLKKQQS